MTAPRRAGHRGRAPARLISSHRCRIRSSTRGDGLLPLTGSTFPADAPTRPRSARDPHGHRIWSRRAVGIGKITGIATFRPVACRATGNAKWCLMPTRTSTLLLLIVTRVRHRLSKRPRGTRGHPLTRSPSAPSQMLTPLFFVATLTRTFSYCRRARRHLTMSPTITGTPSGLRPGMRNLRARHPGDRWIAPGTATTMLTPMIAAHADADVGAAGSGGELAAGAESHPPDGAHLAR